jgi:hypothetical protein
MTAVGYPGGVQLIDAEPVLAGSPLPPPAPHATAFKLRGDGDVPVAMALDRSKLMVATRSAEVSWCAARRRITSAHCTPYFEGCAILPICPGRSWHKHAAQCSTLAQAFARPVNVAAHGRNRSVAIASPRRQCCLCVMWAGLCRCCNDLHRCCTGAALSGGQRPPAAALPAAPHWPPASHSRRMQHGALPVRSTSGGVFGWRCARARRLCPGVSLAQVTAYALLCSQHWHGALARLHVASLGASLAPPPCPSLPRSQSVM